MDFNEFLSKYALFIALTVFSVITVLILFFLFIPRLKKEKLVSEETIDKEEFLNLLGGVDNILDISLKGSRLSVSLKDQTIVDLEVLKKHGVDRVIVMQSKLVLLVNKKVARLFNHLA